MTARDEPIELARLRVQLSQHKLERERATEILNNMQGQIEKNPHKNTPEFRIRLQTILDRIRATGESMSETQSQIEQLEETTNE